VTNCLIEGCTSPTESPYTRKATILCLRHWFKLTLHLRQRWWAETDYGKREPTPELVQTIREVLK
jgi:hypothetical protein